MVNHPNRNWRARWSVDLESATATHKDGWSFKFSLVEGEADVYDGTCIARPSPLLPEHATQASRVAREAGDIYLEALNGRH